MLHVSFTLLTFFFSAKKLIKYSYLHGFLFYGSYGCCCVWLWCSICVNVGICRLLTHQKWFDMEQPYYGRPEPTWVINSRQRHLGDPRYSRLSYSGYPDIGPYSQGPLLPVSFCSTNKIPQVNIVLKVQMLLYFSDPWIPLSSSKKLQVNHVFLHDKIVE